MVIIFVALQVLNDRSFIPSQLKPEPQASKGLSISPLLFNIISDSYWGKKNSSYLYYEYNFNKKEYIYLYFIVYFIIKALLLQK